MILTHIGCETWYFECIHSELRLFHTYVETIVMHVLILNGVAAMLQDNTYELATQFLTLNCKIMSIY